MGSEGRSRGSHSAYARAVPRQRSTVQKGDQGEETLTECLTEDSGKKILGIDLQRIGELAEFQNIQLPLATFNLADERVRSRKTPCKFSLRHPSLHPGGRK